MAKNQELSAIIREIKFKKGLTQSEIARQIGVSPQYLSDVLNERFPFNTDLRSKVYVLLNPEEDLSPSEIEKTPSEEKWKQIPVLPIAAQGGSLNDFTLSVRMYDCEWMASPNPNADFAIEVAGESMMPEYPPGARVFIKRINERAFIEWGEVFVLDTENGIVLKQVHPADDDNCIHCVSINPNYAPFNIPKASIYGMYMVLGVYAKKK